MTFDASDAGARIDGMCREILTGDQFRETAPSRAVAAGEGVA